MVIKLADISVDHVKNSRLRISPEAVLKNAEQGARMREEEAKLAHLADSIKTHGLLEPLVVYLTGGKGVNAKGEGQPKYALWAGFRRRDAILRAGYKEIPEEWLRIVPAPKSEADAIIVNAVENLQREDLSPVERADVIARLRKTGLKLKTIGEKLGLADSSVSNYDRVAKAPFFDALKAAWVEGQPVPSHRACIDILGAAGDDAEKAAEYFGQAMKAAKRSAEGPDFTGPGAGSGAGAGEGAGGGSSGSSGGLPVRSPAAFQSVREAARAEGYEAAKGDTYKAGFWAALQWGVNGMVKGPDGKVGLPFAWTAPTKGRKADPEKAAAKAAEKEAKKAAKAAEKAAKATNGAPPTVPQGKAGKADAAGASA